MLRSSESKRRTILSSSASRTMSLSSSSTKYRIDFLLLNPPYSTPYVLRTTFVVLSAASMPQHTSEDKSLTCYVTLISPYSPLLFGKGTAAPSAPFPALRGGPRSLLGSSLLAQGLIYRTQILHTAKGAARGVRAALPVPLVRKMAEEPWQIWTGDAKYPGPCAVCGGHITHGPFVYVKGTKKQWHVPCYFGHAPESPAEAMQPEPPTSIRQEPELTPRDVMEAMVGELAEAVQRLTWAVDKANMLAEKRNALLEAHGEKKVP